MIYYCKSAPNDTWTDSGGAEILNMPCQSKTFTLSAAGIQNVQLHAISLSHSMPWRQHPMQWVLLKCTNRSTDADTPEVTLVLFFFFTIQEGPCCFCNKTGTWVHYECMDYHFGCSNHNQISCGMTQCTVGVHKPNNTHIWSRTESGSYWVGCSCSSLTSTADHLGQSVIMWCDINK